MYEMKGPRLVLRARHQLVAQPLPYRAWPGPAGPSPAGCPATAVPRL